MKTIHLMIGIQGSGKTTLAKKLATTYHAKIISTDEVRKNYPHIEEEVCCPEKLNEMISLAQKLSEGFAFVRVDFYYINNIIYFGELTFTPQSGIGKWDDPMQNLHYGELIKLPPRKSLPQRRNYV